jgi:MYXO-CTERM domain-containing protein
MMACAAGVSFAATEARADVADPSGPNASTGTAKFHYDYTKTLDTSIDTGWIGPSAVQFRAVLAIDPVQNGGPLFSIDMPKGAILQASWAGDKKIVLQPVNGAATDGTVSVRHTLTPDVQVKVSAFGLNATFSISALKLIDKINGGAFAYDSQAKQAFAPWAFPGVNTVLNAPNLDSANLFDPIGFDNFPDIIANNIDGEFSVKAITKPTFTYKTTKVTLQGSDKPVTAAGGQSVLAAPNGEFGDYAEIATTVEGDMTVAGELDIEPYVNITRVLNFSGVSIGVGYPLVKKTYTTPATHVTFQTAMIHIPLPNVQVPTNGVDMGFVKAGGTSSKTVTISNSGEKAAVLNFKSSDPRFTVAGGPVTVAPKDKYDLEVKFSGDTSAASSDIEVDSNDPDAPAQTFKATANGADGTGGDKPGDANVPGGGGGSSGCGCVTAGASSLPSWAGLGLLGLGAVVFIRRRKA